MQAISIMMLIVAVKSHQSTVPYRAPSALVLPHFLFSCIILFFWPAERKLFRHFSRGMCKYKFTQNGNEHINHQRHFVMYRLAGVLLVASFILIDLKVG